jgi:hypothetical protein
MPATTDHPNPWARGTGPLPDNPAKLTAEIQALAAARRRDAAAHPRSCHCDGCKVRRLDQQRRELGRLAA